MVGVPSRPPDQIDAATPPRRGSARKMKGGRSSARKRRSIPTRRTRSPAATSAGARPAPAADRVRGRAEGHAGRRVAGAAERRRLHIVKLNATARAQRPDRRRADARGTSSSASTRRPRAKRRRPDRPRADSIDTGAKFADQARLNSEDASASEGRPGLDQSRRHGARVRAGDEQAEDQRDLGPCARPSDNLIVVEERRTQDVSGRAKRDNARNGDPRAQVGRGSPSSCGGSGIARTSK